MANVTSQEAATSSGDDSYLQKQMQMLSNTLLKWEGEYEELTWLPN